MSNSSKAQTSQPVDNSLKNNPISGFDFGFDRGEWLNNRCYVAEPVPGVGLIIYIAGSIEWSVSFFRSKSKDKLAYEHTDYIMSHGRDRHSHKVISHAVTDLLSIIALVNVYTSGEKDDGATGRTGIFQNIDPGVTTPPYQ